MPLTKCCTPGYRRSAGTARALRSPECTQGAHKGRACDCGGQQLRGKHANAGGDAQTDPGGQLACAGKLKELGRTFVPAAAEWSWQAASMVRLERLHRKKKNRANFSSTAAKLLSLPGYEAGAGPGVSVIMISPGPLRGNQGDRKIMDKSSFGQ